MNELIQSDPLFKDLHFDNTPHLEDILTLFEVDVNDDDQDDTIRFSFQYQNIVSLL